MDSLLTTLPLTVSCALNHAEHSITTNVAPGCQKTNPGCKRQIDYGVFDQLFTLSKMTDISCRWRNTRARSDMFTTSYGRITGVVIWREMLMK